MISVFGSLRGIAKTPSVINDNLIFRLHYKFTAACLVASGLLITSKQYFGNPIDCISNDDISTDVLKTFCWIHATFSLPSAFGKSVGSEVPYPGVDKSARKDEDRVYHSYYQWVCFVLLLQAAFFYFPHFVWKLWEGDKIKNLILDLNLPVGGKDENVNLVAKYLARHMERHEWYVFCYVFCEVLNFANVIGQMFLLNKFLGGEFIRFGIRVMQFSGTDQEFRNDYMVRVFPRMAKCTFYRHGPSGDVQRHDAFCILPLNIVNEKIYIFLWFWFVLLAVASGLVVVYRSLLILLRGFRYRVLVSRAKGVERNVVRDVHEHMYFGDWFVMHLLSKNVDSVNLSRLYVKLYSLLEGKRVGFASLKESEV